MIMRIQVSKVMCKELNKAIKEKDIKDFKIEYVEMTLNKYAFHVDYNAFNHYDDWLFEKNKMKVLKVLYPHAYYAVPAYITTNDLIRIFNNLSDETFDCFVQAIYDEYAI